MKEEVVPDELRVENQRLRAQVQRMAERIAYLERLLWGGKRDKRVAQGPTLFDAFFNEAADAREAAIAETVQEIRKEAEKRRACGRKKPERPKRYLYTGLPARGGRKAGRGGGKDRKGIRRRQETETSEP